LKSSFPIHLLPLAALAVVASVPSMAETPSTASSPLGSTYFTWDTLVSTPTPSGARYDVVDSKTPTFERLSIHITTLNPGAAVHPPQHHAQEEAILIKDGDLELWLNGRTMRVGTGSLIFLAANAVHNITNVGIKSATYYVFGVRTAATMTVPDRPADEWAPPGKLRSSVFDCESLPTKANKNGMHCSVVDSPTATFVEFESHLTTLNPGANTGLLTDPADEVIVVKSGLVESYLRGITCRLGPGSFYFQAANDIHSMKNVGSVPATYQVFKWVVPDANSKQSP
jgi:quercetin dioxygenase-like cupin family protein